LAYKDAGWVGLGDWLGTGRVAYQNLIYLPFEEAREFVRGLGLGNQKEWKTWVKNNAQSKSIPIRPDAAYTNNGWRNWGDWLGTERIANQNRVYRSFEDARVFVHTLGLQNQSEWSIWARSANRPIDIPAKPRTVYKNKGWVSMGDWLGTGRIASFNIIYRPFQEAREFARSLGLKNGQEWRKWARSAECPDDIPIMPHSVYKNEGWVSLGDWLGTDYTANQERVYLPFNEART
jgi:hypothetical protein